MGGEVMSEKAERPLKDDEKDAGAMYAKATFVKAERPLKDDEKAGAMDPKAMNAEAARMPDRPGWL